MSLELLVEALGECNTTPVSMGRPRHRPEVGNSLTNRILSDVSLSVRASLIAKARPDCDWNFLDIAKINELRLLSEIRSVLRNILLEAVNQTVLGPMNHSLD